MILCIKRTSATLAPPIIGSGSCNKVQHLNCAWNRNPAGANLHSPPPVSLRLGLHHRHQLPRLYASPNESEPTTPQGALSAENPFAEIEVEGVFAIRYLILVVFFATLGLAEILAPQRVLELAYAAVTLPHSVTLDTMRILGGSHVMSGLVAYALTESHKFDSPTFVRLNLGLAFWGLITLAAIYSGPVFMTDGAAIVSGSMALLAVFTGLSAFRRSSTLFTQPFIKWIKGFAQGVKSITDYGSVNDFVYGIATKATLLMPIALWKASLPVIKKSILNVSVGPLGESILRQAAATTLFAAFVLFSLKLAAKAGKITRPEYKTLGLGIMLNSWVYFAVMLTWIKRGLVVLNATGGINTLKLIAGTNVGVMNVLMIVSIYNYFKKEKKQ